MSDKESGLKEIDRPPTLVSAVADSIRREILSGSMLPGQPLHEIELSKALNISRGTLREALRKLEQEGLVEVFPHRGAFVARLSPRKVKEIYTLRCLLEPYAVRLTVENKAFTQTDFDEMEALVERLGELERSGDYAQSVETDMRFHQLISRRCGHSLLLEVLQNLQSLTLMMILNTKLYRSDVVPDDITHQAILDGIRSGDAELAAKIVEKHILDAGSSLLQRMEEQERVGQAVSG